MFLKKNGVDLQVLFQYISGFYSTEHSSNHLAPVRYVVILFPFYRGKNCGSERQEKVLILRFLKRNGIRDPIRHLRSPRRAKTNCIIWLTDTSWHKGLSSGSPLGPLLSLWLFLCLSEWGATFFYSSPSHFAQSAAGGETPSSFGVFLLTFSTASGSLPSI